MFQRNVVEKIKTHFLCSIALSWKSCRLRHNVENYCRAGQATGENIIQRMRFAYWITKATNIRSEYVIRIAYPLQQWLRERASVLRLYVHYVSSLCFAFRYVTYHEALTKKMWKIPDVT